jgi:ATP-dependent RNA helicase DHX29
VIDRKIKFRVSPKTNVALRHLRSQLGSVLALQFKGKPLTESQLLWKELGEMVLGKIRIVDPDEPGGVGQITVVNH